MLPLGIRCCLLKRLFHPPSRQSICRPMLPGSAPGISRPVGAGVGGSILSPSSVPGISRPVRTPPFHQHLWCLGPSAGCLPSVQSLAAKTNGYWLRPWYLKTSGGCLPAILSIFNCSDSVASEPRQAVFLLSSPWLPTPVGTGFARGISRPVGAACLPSSHISTRVSSRPVH